MTKKERLAEINEIVHEWTVITCLTQDIACKSTNDLLNEFIESRGGAENLKIKGLKWKDIKALKDERRQIIADLESEKGAIWNYENWITDIHSDNRGDFEDARQNLLDKIKNLNGVTIASGGKGVKMVQVATKNKIYTYSIHAHLCGDGEAVWGENGEYNNVIAILHREGCYWRDTDDAMKGVI